MTMGGNHTLRDPAVFDSVGAPAQAFLAAGEVKPSAGEPKGTVQAVTSTSSYGHSWHRQAHVGSKFTRLLAPQH
jgi:hypothetical protein